MQEISQDDLLFNVPVDLRILQGNEDSPYSSAETFDDVVENPNLLQAIFEMEYNEPSKIQGIALPIVTDKNRWNLLAQSQNGTGKTLAFCIAMIQRIDPNNPHLQAICLVENRELANQTYKYYIEPLTQYMNIRKLLLIPGGGAFDPKAAEGPQLIVTTPTPLERHSDNLELNFVRTFAIDEADHILDNSSFRRTIEFIMQTLSREYCQILLFSATINQQVHDFAGKFMEPRCKKILVGKEQQFIPTNDHFFIRVSSDEEKFDVLSQIFSYATSAQSFIFFNTKSQVKRVKEMLQNQEFDAAVLINDSENRRQKRDETVEKFRHGEIKVLLTTNIVARGLDIPAAHLVINYDMPVTKEKNKYVPDIATYMHRQGRTGRFGRYGKVINFVLSDTDMEGIEELMNPAGYGLKMTEFTKDKCNLFVDAAKRVNT